MSARLASFVLGLLLAAPAAAQLDVDFTAVPTSGPNPLTVFFTDTTTGGTPLGWSWTFGDGSSGVAQHPAHVYTTPGTYTVSLTVFGPGGTLDTETKTGLVTVEPGTLVPGFEIEGRQGAHPHEVSFTDTSTGLVTGWHWEFGDGFTSSAQHPTHTYFTPGTYVPELTVFSGGQASPPVSGEPVFVQAQFGEKGVVAGGQVLATDVALGDLDGDGDLDAVTADSDGDTLAWSENLDGLGRFGPSWVLASNADGVNTVDVADLDLDGDQDVLLGTMDGDQIGWFENVDGVGTFAGPRLVAAGVNQPRDVRAADLDGDGRPDVVAVVSEIEDILWWRNELDTSGGWAGPLVVTDVVNNARTLEPADLDGDGDVDLAVTTIFVAALWLENLDGLGTFGPPTNLSAADGEHLAAVDLDGDTHLDLLVVDEDTDDVVWYANVGGDGAFVLQGLVTNQLVNPHRVAAVDMDDDGDLDVVVNARSSSGLVWVENLDGAGNFGGAQLLTAGSNTSQERGLAVGDVDGDGDPDVVSAGHAASETAWWPSILRPPFWQDLGGGAVGSEGYPALRTSGTLEGGTPLGLSVSGGPPGAVGLLGLSFASEPVQDFGGTVHVNPIAFQRFVGLDGAGTWTLAAAWPPGIPLGTRFWVQVFVEDPAGPGGVTVTNGVTASTP